MTAVILLRKSSLRDTMTIELKPKVPQQLVGSGESTGSISTNSNFCFSWAKHHISLFWMLMRAVTKL